MIYILPFFGILNVILTSYFKIKIIYYIVFFEGILLLMISNTLQKRIVSYQLKKEKKINNNDIQIIKKLLLIISLIYIVFTPLYIINLIPSDTDIIILGSIPVLISIYIFNKIRK